MAGSRTLKLSILADVDDLRKKLGDGSKEVEGFGGKVADFSKKAAAAFAVAAVAAAAYASKLLIDGVKAAIEDEKAQTALATSLRNVAGANDAVVAGVEKYITKTALAVGVTDDQLRPSFDRLVRSTKSVEEAQKLQALALDISAGSGKSLEAVSAALGRAYDGNVTSLGRLGVGLSAAELKSMTFDEAAKALATTFGGQATEQAETFAGKMERLSIAVDEGKETVGAFVLDAITPLISNFVEKGIPAIAAFADEIGPKLTPIIQTIVSVFRDFLIPTFQKWWSLVSENIVPAISAVVVPVFNGLKIAFDTIKNAVMANRDEFAKLEPVFRAVWKFVKDNLAPVLGGVLKAALVAIGSVIGTLVSGFGKLAGFIGDAFKQLSKFINLIKNNPIVEGISNVVGGLFGGGRAEGGAVKAGTSYVVGERGAEMFVPKTDGVIIPNNKMGGGGTVNNFNINVSGALDQEGVARQIVDLLNNSFYRGTVGAGGLVTT
jgi:hypothetical protein